MDYLPYLVAFVFSILVSRFSVIVLVIGILAGLGYKKDWIHAGILSLVMFLPVYYFYFQYKNFPDRNSKYFPDYTSGTEPEEGTEAYIYKSNFEWLMEKYGVSLDTIKYCLGDYLDISKDSDFWDSFLVAEPKNVYTDNSITVSDYLGTKQDLYDAYNLVPDIVCDRVENTIENILVVRERLRSGVIFSVAFALFFFAMNAFVGNKVFGKIESNISLFRKYT